MSAVRVDVLSQKVYPTLTPANAETQPLTNKLIEMGFKIVSDPVNLSAMNSEERRQMFIFTLEKKSEVQ